MTLRTWLAEPLPKAVAEALARLATARGVRRVAAMPDVHLADHVCVGTVVGTEGWLYPQAIGGDVGCGMAAVALTADRSTLQHEEAATQLLQSLHDEVPALRRRRPYDGALPPFATAQLHHRLERTARIEFGTLGRGNHFLEVQSDEHDRLWLMVHSGSRALGPAVQEHWLAHAEPVGQGLRALAAGSDAANAWLLDLATATQFAAQNRRAIAEAAARSLEALGIGVDFATWFDCTHNFVRAEVHAGEALFVHRKGACSAAEGERAIVPGSMGTRSFHVEGRGCAEAMASCSHGAGRRLPRGEAMRTIRVRDVERQMEGVFFERSMAERLRDEAPSAYKDIGAVMRAQRELVRVVRTLRPVLAWKGG